jgi:hypothetical protein
MPPIALAIVAFIQLAIDPKNVEQAKKIYENGRRLFAMLFGGGVLSVAQQKALNDWAEQHEADTLNGKVPPEFTVEPDPT